MSRKKKPKSLDKQLMIGLKALKENIMSIINSDTTKTLNYKQICSRLEITDSESKELVHKALEVLCKEDLIKESFRGKFNKTERLAYITGKVDLARNGYGFIVTDEYPEDIFVSMHNLNHALDGDIVKVYLFAKKAKSRLEGEVVEIVKRAKETFVGVIEISKKFAFLVPDGKQTNSDIFIPLRSLKGAKNGQKAVVKITEWPSGNKNPIGEVLDVLGDPGDHNTEMHAILAEFELPNKFSAIVEAAAEHLPNKITADECKNRRDFRGITTFTIDPADAKDFDDALSLHKLENGNWEVGVHIADVTHYIQPGDVLEEEACSRATSVYLVDRVIPMLPERLSNGICSLRPNEDKLCYSAVFELNDDAEIVSQWFGRTVICSIRRFAYEEAQKVLDTGEGDLKDEILTLNRLAKLIRAERFKKGSISFERDEVKFDIDENGKPLRVYYKVMGESNQLIEEFMLLANKKVAEYCSGVIKTNCPPRIGKGKTMVYRIHDQPNMEKLNSFASFITKFGYKLSLVSTQKISDSLNDLLETVKGKTEQNLIETLALRSMAKAAYSTVNIGHYGLSFKYYSHFTSPIRRYPDMMAHRLLTYYLEGGKPPNIEDLEDKCKHSSELEKRAVDAERASIKYKQVEFMSDKIGLVFEGVISGVAEFGFFVELTENKCEGLVPMRELVDDFYEFDEDNYCIIGNRKKRKFQLGDLVKVEVARANLVKKQLDFRLIEDDQASSSLNSPKTRVNQ